MNDNQYTVICNGHKRFGVTRIDGHHIVDVTNANLFMGSDKPYSTWFKPMCYIVIVYSVILDVILEKYENRYKKENS